MKDQETVADILVVDDTMENLDVLVSMLSEYGYNVRPAPSGEIALRAAHSVPPDLILLDIRMPIWTGTRSAGLSKMMTELATFRLFSSPSSMKQWRK